MKKNTMLANTLLAIILGAGLFVGMVWRTFMPYAAGALTVLLQLLWKNGLVSIFAGTALYMILVRLFP